MIPGQTDLARSHRPDNPLATLSALAVAANRGGTLAGALPSLLRLLCGSGGWDLGHAHRLAPGPDVARSPDTWWPPKARRFAPFMRATAAVPIHEREIVKRVEQTGGPVWVSDLESADWYVRRGSALDSGLRSVLAFWIQGPNGPVGLVELLGRGVRSVDQAQMELARHAGVVVGQVLEHESGEGRFRRLFDLLPIPIGITSLDEGRFVEVNQALEAFFGRPAAAIVGSTPRDLGVMVEGWDRVRRIEELLGHENAITVEMRINTPAAGDRLVVATVAIVPWKGSPHVLASLIDVTRVRNVERQVEQARTRVRALTSRLLALQEEERTRLSRELHDQIGQRLTALKIVLDRLGRDGEPDGLAREGATIAGDILDDVRTLSFELRPAVLDQLGLPSAIRGYVERSATGAGLRAEVRVDASIATLPDAAQTACFRILQEAVTNVVRHASATTMRIRLAQYGEETTLIVEDDGRGFDPTGTEGVMGLVIMKERAASAGGRVRLMSEVGVGTRVEATFSMGGGAQLELGDVL